MNAGEASTKPNLTERELRRLIDVGRALVTDLDVESVLEQVLETVRELTEARYAALGILDESKQELERFLYVGIDEDTRRVIGPLPRGHGVLGELIRRPEPLRLADVTRHPHSYGFPPGHPPMTSFLGVPIAIRGEAFGNLYLTDKAGGEQFTAARRGARGHPGRVGGHRDRQRTSLSGRAAAPRRARAGRAGARGDRHCRAIRRV